LTPEKRRRGPGLHLSRKLAASGRFARTIARRHGPPVRLRKAIAAGGLYRDKQRPPFWRSLAPSLAGDARVPEIRLNHWLLVLEAKKIPYIFSPKGDRPRLYVSPLHEWAALHEIRAFEQERHLPAFVPPASGNLRGVLLALSLLFIWHGLRMRWFGPALPAPPFPAQPSAWPAAFGLDVYRFRELHEFWRSATALTLHSDGEHLLGNLAFGALFLGLLCRRAGLGLGIALTLAAGCLGNVANALTREAHVLSIGFSTALFGALGGLCCLACADIYGHQRRYPQASGLALELGRRLALPLAAGLALLGMLGGGGEANIDYPAHIWGFCAGVLVALCALPLDRALRQCSGVRRHLAQSLLLALALGGMVAAWAYAVMR
jgi:membrane associated rhomboid family serine protease